MVEKEKPNGKRIRSKWTEFVLLYVAPAIVVCLGTQVCLRWAS
jgi:hypothetical protein